MALAIDLFCGLGGWSEGLLAEGYEVIGFDIKQHQYGEHGYPAQLVLQDVLTLHGRQFRNADLIVASPPCQAYSYRAMPWKRAKALPPPDNTLFEACFRIQREACQAAGRHVPLIVENVRGAQPWVGRARWNFGSFYLWGDVPALMPETIRFAKRPGHDWNRFKKTGEVSPHWRMNDEDSAIKNTGGSWVNIAHNTTSGKGRNPDGRKTPGAPHIRDGHASTKHLTNPAGHGVKQDGSGLAWFDKALDERRKSSPTIKCGGSWFGSGNDRSLMWRHGSKSTKRKAASAMIAKIPFSLARHIARTFLPQQGCLK